jgi:hypothetical protein
LRDDLAVEAIGMMGGQIEEADGMLCRVRQDPQPQIGDAFHPGRLAERQLPSSLFDGDLGRDTTLISRTAVAFRSIEPEVSAEVRGSFGVRSTQWS